MDCTCVEFGLTGSITERGRSMFFGYFSGCGCLGSLVVSIVLTLVLSMCFNAF